MRNIEIKNLFTKYIKRECTEEEVLQIVNYFKASKDFSDVPTAEEVSHLWGDYPDMDEEAANRIYNTIVAKAKEQQLPTKKSFKPWKYAAAVVLFSLGTVYFYQKNTTKAIKPVTIVESIIEVGGDKATLTLEDGSVVVLDGENSYESQNITSNGVQIVYDSNKENTSAEIAYNYLTIPRGGQFFIKLSDGTAVWLNSETQIKYPVSFLDGETRKIELIYGEAYFDVSPSINHKGSKFIVFNNAQEVEVLGTEFNIKAFKDESNIYTTLAEGKVVVTIEGEKQNLIPGQQLFLDKKTNSFLTNEVDVYNEISWKDGVFSFEEKTLKEIMVVLSRWYDMDVEFKNKAIENEEFIGVLRKNQTIEEILLGIKNFGIIKNFEIYDKKVILE